MKLKPVVVSDLLASADLINRVLKRLEKGERIDVTSLRAAATQAHQLGRDLDTIIGAFDAERLLERQTKG